MAVNTSQETTTNTNSWGAFAPQTPPGWGAATPQTPRGEVWGAAAPQLGFSGDPHASPCRGDSPTAQAPESWVHPGPRYLVTFDEHGAFCRSFCPRYLKRLIDTVWFLGFLLWFVLSPGSLRKATGSLWEAPWGPPVFCSSWASRRSVLSVLGFPGVRDGVCCQFWAPGGPFCQFWASRVSVLSVLGFQGGPLCIYWCILPLLGFLGGEGHRARPRQFTVWDSPGVCGRGVHWTNTPRDFVKTVNIAKTVKIDKTVKHVLVHT
jgi:hypothetical protein